jgi:DeoR/GlpR family transcriptional regulator of sugar metabolism
MARFHLILSELDCKPRSVRWLAERLEVSGKTIYRDFDFIRDRLGVELTYDSIKRLWSVQPAENRRCPFCRSIPESK